MLLILSVTLLLHVYQPVLNNLMFGKVYFIKGQRLLSEINKLHMAVIICKIEGYDCNFH